VTSSDEPAAGQQDQAAALVELYDRVLPEIYGYLRRRCGSDAQAEELTSQTFLAAAAAVRRGSVAQLSAPWLQTVARNKLVDHWRRQAREERALRLVELQLEESEWELDRLDEGPALATLQLLSAPQRAALTLRHLDGLSVPEVAECLGRSTQATDALLSRARAAFRRRYPEVSRAEPASVGEAPGAAPDDREEPR
jgi:RNA polymerase sigma-70 factor, ECF subfamily